MDKYTLNFQDINNRTQAAIGDLRAISKIQFGDKWNTYFKGPQKATLWTSVTRTFWYISETSNKTMVYIDLLLDRGFALIDEIQDLLTPTNDVKQTSEVKNYRVKLIRLRNELKTNILQSQTGIINLTGAYHNDEDVKNEIRKLIDRIKNTFQFYDEQKVSKESSIDDIPYQSPTNKDEIYTPVNDKREVVTEKNIDQIEQVLPLVEPVNSERKTKKRKSKSFLYPSPRVSKTLKDNLDDEVGL